MLRRLAVCGEIGAALGLRRASVTISGRTIGAIAFSAALASAVALGYNCCGTVCQSVRKVGQSKALRSKPREKRAGNCRRMTVPEPMNQADDVHSRNRKAGMRGVPGAESQVAGGRGARRGPPHFYLSVILGFLW